MDWKEFKQQTAKRNLKILERYQAGMTKAELARVYGLTRERIGQIIKVYTAKKSTEDNNGN